MVGEGQVVDVGVEVKDTDTVALGEEEVDGEDWVDFDARGVFDTELEGEDERVAEGDLEGLPEADPDRVMVTEGEGVDPADRDARERVPATVME
jgi:hypothetical protein